MKDFFQIYIDRLKEKELLIDATVPPDFLNIDEKELKMNFDVEMKGKAYLLDGYLVIQLFAKTYYQKPCSVCNDFITCALSDEFYLTQPLAEIKNSMFDFSEELRNNLLIKIPHFIECNEGNCIERKKLANYFKKPASNSEYFPFNTLEKK